MSAPEDAPKSAVDLVREIVAQVRVIFRKELDLAQAEITDGLRLMAIGLGSVVAAVVIALTALNILASALVAALIELGLSPIVSALVVGVSLTVIAALLARSGVRKMRPENLVPKRTVAQFRRDAEEIKEVL